VGLGQIEGLEFVAVAWSDSGMTRPLTDVALLKRISPSLAGIVRKAANVMVPASPIAIRTAVIGTRLAREEDLSLARGVADASFPGNEVLQRGQLAA
jgi:hypothetical protein